VRSSVPTRRRLLDERLKRAHHTLAERALRVAFTVARRAGIAKPTPLLGASRETNQLVRDKLRRRRVEQPSGHAVLDNVGYASPPARDHGQPGCHGLEENERQPFEERRQHDEVGRHEQIGDVIALAEEPHHRPQTSRRDGTPQLLLPWALSHPEKPGRGNCREHCGDRLEKESVAFLLG
jgi:hypothetical protein